MHVTVYESFDDDDEIVGWIDAMVFAFKDTPKQKRRRRTRKNKGNPVCTRSIPTPIPRECGSMCGEDGDAGYNKSTTIPPIVLTLINPTSADIDKVEIEATRAGCVPLYFLNGEISNVKYGFIRQGTLTAKNMIAIHIKIVT